MLHVLVYEPEKALTATVTITTARTPRASSGQKYPTLHEPVKKVSEERDENVQSGQKFRQRISIQPYVVKA